MGLFMAKIAHNGELVPGQRNPPGNWLMSHITSHYIGKHSEVPVTYKDEIRDVFLSKIGAF